MSTRRVIQLDTDQREPTFIKWNPIGPHLAIGTNKGHLLIYNRHTQRKTPIVGKHSRAIISGKSCLFLFLSFHFSQIYLSLSFSCIFVSQGAWSKTNRLALGSEDRHLTLSSEDGNTIDQTDLKVKLHFFYFFKFFLKKKWIKIGRISRHCLITLTVNFFVCSMTLSTSNFPNKKLTELKIATIRLFQLIWAGKHCFYII